MRFNYGVTRRPASGNCYRDTIRERASNYDVRNHHNCSLFFCKWSWYCYVIVTDVLRISHMCNSIMVQYFLDVLNKLVPHKSFDNSRDRASSNIDILTQICIESSCGVKYLGQHGFKKWDVSWPNWAITPGYANLSSIRMGHSSGSMPQDMFTMSLWNIKLLYIYQSYLRWANE